MEESEPPVRELTGTSRSRLPFCPKDEQSWRQELYRGCRDGRSSDALH